jgi:hypothetical protein
MNGAVTVKAGNTMILSPGGSLRLNDLDNLRVLATKKGLILREGGQPAMKLLWKGSAKTSGKVAAAAAKASANAGQAKAMAVSAKSMAVSADALAKTAHGFAPSVLSWS